MQHWLRHSKLNPTRTALQMTTQPNAALQQLASPSRVLGRLEIVRFRRGERNKMTSEEFNQVSQKNKNDPTHEIVQEPGIRTNLSQ